MADIPTDAWREIFVRLPAKSLIRCRAVSKEFRAVIDDRRFSKAYTKKQLSSNSATNVILRNSAGPPFHPLCSFDLDALNFDGSSLQKISATPLDFTHGRQLAFPVAACDGLMLVAPGGRQENWQIWNPSTHESLDLPQPDAGFFEPFEIVATGLGFDESTDDYKAVVISRSEWDDDPDKYIYMTHVYSLKSDSWRPLSNFPTDEFDGPKGPSVFMGGALNWFFAPDKKPERIVALDLRTETYRELKLPSLPERPFAMVQQRYLDLLDSGRLVLTDFGYLCNPEGERENFDVWVMKDYEVEDSWERLFSVEMEGACAVSGDCWHVVFLSNKLQFLFQNLWEFLLYDVQTSCVKRVCIKGIDIGAVRTLSAQVVPDSIFRLHDNCGVGGRKRTIMKREESKSNVQMADLEIEFCVGKEIEWNIF